MPTQPAPPATPLDAALGYAARGWPVFPCSPRDKTPLLPADRDEQGKPIKGTGGLKKATTDAELIAGWWRKWPKALPAIATGHATNDAGGLRLFVVDFDPRVEESVEDGTGEIITTEWTLDQLKLETEQQIGASLPPSLASVTPSGGVHLYLLMPDDEGAPINNRGNLPTHVDVRGLGGYVIAPPGVMAPDAVKGQGGKGYRWLRGKADAPPAVAPAELIATLRAPKRSAATKPHQPAGTAGLPRPAATGDPRGDAVRKFALSAVEAECGILAGTPVGNRNNQSNASGFVIGQLIAAGAIGEGLARGALYDAVAGFNDPDKARQAVDNGLDAGMRPENARDLSGVGTRAGRGPPASQRPAPHPNGGSEGQPFQGGMEGEQRDGVGAALPVDGGAGGRVTVAPDPEVDRKCAFFPMTDLGNAERFRFRHGHRFRFCRELGWFAWDGRRWDLLSEEKDRTPGEVLHAVFETVRAIRNEADLVADSGIKEEAESPADEKTRLDFIVQIKGTKANPIFVYFSDKLRDHAKSSEGASRLGCVANLAKAFADIAVEAEAMDADRMAINVLNGTLRLVRSGDEWSIQIKPHDPGDLISKIADVAYKPKAASPLYDAFLERVQPDADMRRFLHQWGGLSATGDISDHAMAFFHGQGRNGKSTWVDSIAWMLGDYAMTIKFDTFLVQGKQQSAGSAPTPDLARLPGVRFLRASEPEKGAKLNEALIKEVTGGEPITARHLNKAFFDFLPSFKLTSQGNHRPKITGNDDGIWARVKLVPWAVQIPKPERDRKLPEKLKGEASGIFNRILEGLLDWRTNGLIEPEAVTEATRKYREASDQLGRFLAECTVQEEDGRARSSHLFALFQIWSKADGAAEWSPVGFSKALEDRGFEKTHSNGVYWLGLQMTRTVEEFAEQSAEPERTEQRGADPPAVGPQDEDVWP